MTYTPISDGTTGWGPLVNAGILDVQNQAVTAQATATAAVAKDAIFLNVKDHGVKGDGVTDDTTAILAVLASVPASGGTVYFPYGKYIISTPLTPKSGTSLLAYSKFGLYPGSTTLSSTTVISASASFSGSWMLSLDGSVSALTNVSAVGLLFDGSASPASVGGVFINGNSTGIVLDNVVTSHTTGTGVKIAVAGGNTPNVYCNRVTAWYGGVHGWDVAVQDSTFNACMGFNATQNNWNVTSANDCVFNLCRAEHATQYGFYVNVTSATTTIVFNACSTDQNNWDGLRVDTSTGNGPIQINACSFRRDGNNAGAGSTQYAGITVNNSTIPVIIDGTNVAPMKGDTAGYGPYYGLNVATSSFVRATGGYFGCVSGGLPFNYDGSGSLLLTGGALTGSNNQTGFPGTTSTSSIFQQSGIPTPRGANSMIAWTSDPAIIPTSQSVIVSGSLYLNAVFVDTPSVTAKAFLWVGTAGTGTVTAGQNFVALYDSSGNLLASVGVDSIITVAAGLFQATWTTPKLLQPGMYWVALVTNFTGTGPQIIRNSSGFNNAVNMNVPASRFRTAVNGTSVTALPSPLVPASNSASGALPFWMTIG